MQLPALLPEELAYCEKFADEQALFQGLVQKPSDLIFFFDIAAEDETWCEEHPWLIRSLLRWGAKQLYLHKLPRYSALTMVKAVQRHASVFKSHLYFRPALFYNATLELEALKFPVNSLLYGAMSAYFYERFNRRYDLFRSDISLTKTTPALLRLVDEHILKGAIADLWKCEKAEILALMRQAKAWDLPLLVEECAVLLRRYIDQDNVVDTLLQAHQEGFSLWKEECYNFLNSHFRGLRFLPGKPEDLYIEWMDYKDETLDLFKRLAPCITHMAFGGRLSASPNFQKAINRCPKLIGLDFSGSEDFFNLELPFDLVELNVSACTWLAPGNLRALFYQCPDLKRVHLANNVHLSYLAWSHLNRLTDLVELDVACCSQIGDDELKLISRACPRLAELDLEECKNITDAGILELLNVCPHLAILNLSRCYGLTDKTLTYLGMHALELSHLTLVRGIGFSEKALARFIRQRNTLRVLDIRQSEFSLQFLIRLKREFPNVTIVD